MAKSWDEKLNNLSVKLSDLSKKTAEAADDAKAYRELMQEAIDEKISTVKGNAAAMQENARLAGEEHQSKIRSEILKLRMTAKAKLRSGPYFIAVCRSDEATSSDTSSQLERTKPPLPRASCSSWAALRCRSTTGMPTCRLQARRSGATRRMCRSPRTGSMPATS